MSIYTPRVLLFYIPNRIYTKARASACNCFSRFWRRYREMEMRQEEREPDGGGGGGERDWSQLPGSFLLGVRERLSYFENGRVSHVCKNWQEAINPQSAVFDAARLPWILCSGGGNPSTKWTLIDISTQQTFTIPIPIALRGTTCLASKQGWLLLKSSSSPPSTAGRSQTFFYLYNLITGVTRDLPVVEDGGGTDQGKGIDLAGIPIATQFNIFQRPRLEAAKEQESPGIGQAVIGATVSGAFFVVLANYQKDIGLILRIARPGDAAWELHTIKWGTSADARVASLIMRGSTQVHCFDQSGRMHVFGLQEKSWLAFPELRNPAPGFVTECQGEIVRVCRQVPDNWVPDGSWTLTLGYINGPFIFYKLDMDEGISWVEIKKPELENRVWFLGTMCSYSVKGQGAKIYQFQCHSKGDRIYRFRGNQCRIRQEHDLELNHDVEVRFHNVDCSVPQPQPDDYHQFWLGGADQLHQPVASMYITGESLWPDLIRDVSQAVWFDIGGLI